MALVCLPLGVLGQVECDSSFPGSDELTQSLDQSVDPGNSPSCNAGGVTADNGYLRIFDFGLQGVTGKLVVTAIEIGIEVADPGLGFSTQPVTIRIHDFTGVYTPGVGIPAGTLTEVASQTFGLPALAGPGLQCFEFDLPPLLDTSFMNDVAVEVDIPSAVTPGTGHTFFIGSNDFGETRQGYLRSVECGIPEPQPLATLGFPDTFIVMNFHYLPALCLFGYLRGDVDHNGALNALADALHLLAFAFLGGPPPLCFDEADVDGDGGVNGLVDSLYLLTFGFLGGPPPPPPWPACESAPDVVGCQSPAC